MAIDRDQVITDMSKIGVTADGNGLIPAFGVFVNQLPASLWNSFAARLVHSVDDSLVQDAESLLVNCAHECGYHTGHGIIASPEWEAIVAPAVESAEDVLHGAFAVMTAWGWANAEIVSLTPEQRMVVRARNYYESDVVRQGKARRPGAYMLRGVSAAFMDLAYGGPYDATGKTGLRTFQSVQPKAMECGDEYGEFVVTRQSDNRAIA